MSKTVVNPGRTAGGRTRRPLAGVVAIALAAALAGAPTAASASTSTRSAGPGVAAAIVTAGAMSATRDLYVTMTCPEGTTAVAVTGEVQGFEGATINMLMPKGRQAVARATTIREATSAWSVRAWTLCVGASPDIEYVTKTWTLNTPLAYGATLSCPAGKELISVGWSTEGAARPTIVHPMPVSSAGSDLLNSVVMDSYVDGDGAAPRTQTAVVVCAAPGNGSRVVSSDVSTSTGPNHAAATCPAGQRVNAVSPRLPAAGPKGHLLRGMEIEPDGLTGTMDSVALDSVNNRGTAVLVLCVDF